MIFSQLLAGVIAISTPFMLSNISTLNLGEDGGLAEGRGGGGGGGLWVGNILFWAIFLHFHEFLPKIKYCSEVFSNKNSFN